jgi:hypothetical protein
MCAKALVYTCLTAEICILYSHMALQIVTPQAQASYSIPDELWACLSAMSVCVLICSFSFTNVGKGFPAHTMEAAPANMPAAPWRHVHGAHARGADRSQMLSQERGVSMTLHTMEVTEAHSEATYPWKLHTIV